MPFYVFAWIGSLTSGILVVIAKLTSKYSISNPWLFNFLLTLVTFGFTVPIALWNHAGYPVDFVPIILAAITYVFFNILWIHATYLLEVSVLTPLFNFRGIFAVLIGIIFLNENMVPEMWIYVLIIFVAGLFVSMDEKFSLKSFFTKSVFIGIATVLMLAVSNSFVKLAQAHNSLWTTNLWINIIGVSLTFLTLPKFYKNIRQIKIGNVVPILSMGVFSVISEFTANAAYAVNVGVSSLIMNTPFSMIIVILLSLFIPNLLEKHSYKIYAIRLIATAIMIFSSIQLAR